MRILNLGAGGFIGSHLTRRLLAEGHTVVALDLYSDKLAEFVDQACVLHGKRLIQFSTCEVYGRTAASLADAELRDPEDPVWSALIPCVAKATSFSKRYS